MKPLRKVGQNKSMESVEINEIGLIVNPPIAHTANEIIVALIKDK